MSRYLSRKYGSLLPTWKKPDKDAEVIYQRGGTAPKGYVMVGTHSQPQHMGNRGTPKTYNVFRKMQPIPKDKKPKGSAPPPPPPQAPPPMVPQRLPVQQPQPNQMDMLMPLLMAAIAPKPAPPPPEPVTYASAGQAAQSVPGVKIKKSPARINRQNTLGTRGAFNRNDLRISNLNI